jgi:hypothetical protein
LRAPALYAAHVSAVALSSGTSHLVRVKVRVMVRVRVRVRVRV